MSVFVERASGARSLYIFWAKFSADFEYVRRMLVIDTISPPVKVNTKRFHFIN